MKPNLWQPAFLHTDMAEPRIPVRMNLLCCTICRKVLRNPVTIPCRHNFCVRCIQDRWDHDERTNSPCSCPECGFTFPSRPKLIKSTTTLADLVRDTERSDAGGEKRKQQLSGTSMQALKRPRSWTETGKLLCFRNSNSLDVSCCTDASAEHMGHNIGLVKTERKRKQVLRK